MKIWFINVSCLEICISFCHQWLTARYHRDLRSPNIWKLHGWLHEIQGKLSYLAFKLIRSQQKSPKGPFICTLQRFELKLRFFVITYSNQSWKVVTLATTREWTIWYYHHLPRVVPFLLHRSLKSKAQHS